MTLGLAFWIIMLVWLVFGVWAAWPDLKASGGSGLLFALLVLLGWKVFGAPIQS